MERELYEGLYEVDDTDNEVDFGAEDFEGEDFEGEDFEGEDFEGDPEVGRLSREERQGYRSRRRAAPRGRAGRDERRDIRHDRRSDRRDNDDDYDGRPLNDPTKKVKIMRPKQLTGSFTYSSTAPSGVITIRAQRTFHIKDFCITGLASSEVTNITNGDDVLLNEPAGVDIAVYAPGTNFRSIFSKGVIEKGTDFTVAVTLPGAGSVTVVLQGEQEKSCD